MGIVLSCDACTPSSSAYSGSRVRRLLVWCSYRTYLMPWPSDKKMRGAP